MAGERQVSVIETQSVTSGFDESAQQAKALGAAFDGVTKSSKELTQAEINLESSVNRLDARFNESIRTANDVAKAQATIARARAQGVGTEEQYARILNGATERHQAALARQAAALRESGAAANDNARSFGLAGYQVRNLAAQFQDLVVQIGSGQGIFRPLLQQGPQIVDALGQSPGGVGGALKGIVGGLKNISPLSWLAFGIVGVAGAVGAASLALAKHGAELERNEARLRAFSSQASQIITVAQQATAGLGVSATGGVRDLTEAFTRFGAALGVTNVGQITENFVRLSTTLSATKEQSEAAAAAFAKLVQQANLTSGDLIAFAEKFPQFAKVAADALGTTTNELLTMSKTVPVVGQNLVDALNRGGAAAEANIRPWNALSNSVSNYIDKTAKVLSQDLDATLDNAASGVTALGKAWDWLTGKVEEYGRSVLGLPDPPAAPATPRPALRPQPAPARDLGTAAGSSSRGGGGQREVLYGREISQTGEKTLREIHEGNVVRQRAAEQAADAARQAQRDAAEQKAAEEASRAAAEAYQEYVAKNIADRELAQSRGFNWTGQGALDAFGKALDPARNSLNGLAAAATRVTKSIIPIENTMASIFQGSAGFELPAFGWDRPMPLQMAADKRLEAQISALMNMPGRPMSRADAERQARISLRAQQDPFHNIADFIAAPKDDIEELGEAAQTAADKLGDISSLGQPIEQKIGTLRSLQETALSRAYRPDPYAEKNPEFFYSGERIFKESQDKVYEGLQRQIVKLENLQVSLGTLVQQNEMLPQTLVNALIAAGFADIAERIIAAFATRSTPSATPNPTAVQPPSMNQDTYAFMGRT